MCVFSFANTLETNRYQHPLQVDAFDRPQSDASEYFVQHFDSQFGALPHHILRGRCKLVIKFEEKEKSLFVECKTCVAPLVSAFFSFLSPNMCVCA